MDLRIKDICTQKGITMKQLAESMGIAATSLSRSLNNNPTIDTLQKIADTLGVHLVELFQQPTNDTFSCPKCGAKLKLTLEE
ncbi:helix-turn-helix domain-containing protein [Dysgonomonas mossii]|uniref:helix-turn-helix domain-containing protein n=1 Tax=Dysgonomonas mossii TaxID=163665 RepID=UPI00399162B7